MNKDNKKILIMDRQRLDGVFRSAYAAQVLKQRKKTDIIVLTENSESSISVQTYKKLGVNNFIYLRKQKNLSNIGTIVLSLIGSIYLFFNLSFFKKFTISNYKINNIKIGDLIIDHQARYNKNYFKKKFFNFYTFRSIYNIYFSFLFIKNLVLKKKIELCITTSYSYASISSIAIRVALFYKKKVLVIAGSEYKLFKNYDESLKGFGKFNKKSFEKFYKKNENKKKSVLYFNKRINARTFSKNKKDFKINNVNKHDWDVYRSFYNKKTFTKKNFYKFLGFKNLNKPICTIALHAFSDANHLYGNLVFSSFYDEFLETIDYLKNKNNFYWIIKIHPTAGKYGEDGLVEKIIHEKRISNLKILPNFVSTKTILNLSDKLITTRGTIAIEYAALGKKPITSGDSYFKDFNITFKPKSKSQFFNLIKNNNFPKRLSKKKSILAKNILYYMKVNLVKENIYNLTKPASETGNKKFLYYLNKNLSTLIENKKLIKNKIFWKYKKMLNNIKSF